MENLQNSGGKTVAELAPNLFNVIPKRIVKRRTVSQTLTNHCWVIDIKGALTVQVLREYLRIWHIHQQVSISSNVHGDDQVLPLEKNLEELGTP
ncbi:hypothetical protein U9M48_036884 [Paspalum notatum var. saurae]|uniref:Uncharacterized protein n=1 Tax=Paspalum notatum var. saurae TaxID=547442 RepID=A0AAQ3UDX7_PASNO